MAEKQQQQRQQKQKQQSRMLTLPTWGLLLNKYVSKTVNDSPALSSCEADGIKRTIRSFLPAYPDGVEVLTKIEIREFDLVRRMKTRAIRWMDTSDGHIGHIPKVGETRQARLRAGTYNQLRCEGQLVYVCGDWRHSADEAGIVFSELMYENKHHVNEYEEYIVPVRVKQLIRFADFHRYFQPTPSSSQDYVGGSLFRKEDVCRANDFLLRYWEYHNETKYELYYRFPVGTKLNGKVDEGAWARVLVDFSNGGTSSSLVALYQPLSHIEMQKLGLRDIEITGDVIIWDEGQLMMEGYKSLPEIGRVLQIPEYPIMSRTAKDSSLWLLHGLASPQTGGVIECEIVPCGRSDSSKSHKNKDADASAATEIDVRVKQSIPFEELGEQITCYNFDHMRSGNGYYLADGCGNYFGLHDDDEDWLETTTRLGTNFVLREGSSSNDGDKETHLLHDHPKIGWVCILKIQGWKNDGVVECWDF